MDNVGLSGLSFHKRLTMYIQEDKIVGRPPPSLLAPTYAIQNHTLSAQFRGTGATSSSSNVSASSFPVRTSIWWIL